VDFDFHDYHWKDKEINTRFLIPKNEVEEALKNIQDPDSGAVWKGKKFLFHIDSKSVVRIFTDQKPYRHDNFNTHSVKEYFQDTKYPMHYKPIIEIWSNTACWVYGEECNAEMFPTHLENTFIRRDGKLCEIYSGDTNYSKYLEYLREKHNYLFFIRNKYVPSTEIEVSKTKPEFICQCIICTGIETEKSELFCYCDSCVGHEIDSD